MPTKRKRIRRAVIADRHGLFVIWGITINFNTILTGLVGALSCMALSYIIHTINVNSGYIRSIPQLQKDVLVIKKEQARISKEYSPPIVTTPTPTSN